MSKWYPSGAPKIIQVAFKYGYGTAIVDLNQRVYFDPEPRFSPAIREAIQGLCLSSCANQYCAIMHARGLVAEGFSLNAVKRLVEFQELPDFVEDKTTWEISLRRIAAIFREPGTAERLYASLKELHSDEVIHRIGATVAFSILHKFLLELYSDEIVIEDEPILFQTVDCGTELISYFTEYRQQQTAVYSLCFSCKDLKAADGWLPIERALASLPLEARFSHGVCPRCTERADLRA